MDEETLKKLLRFLFENKSKGELVAALSEAKTDLSGDDAAKLQAMVEGLERDATTAVDQKTIDDISAQLTAGNVSLTLRGRVDRIITAKAEAFVEELRAAQAAAASAATPAPTAAVSEPTATVAAAGPVASARGETPGSTNPDVIGSLKPWTERNPDSSKGGARTP